MPREIEPRRSVALDDAELERFPLTLTCAKSGYFCHSQHHALASLRRRLPEPLAHLHPTLAAARGIAPGDWFRIATRTGSVRFRASIDQAVQPDVVMASYGWWQACDDLGLPAVAITGADSSHYNGLVGAEQLDEVAGSIALRAFPCEISREAGTQGQGWQGFKAFRAQRVTVVPGEHPPEVVELALTAEDGSVLPDFHPGQYVPLALELPGVPGRLERSYSLIGPARLEGRTEYRIAVKRASGSAGVSQALHEIGDECRVWLQSPRGQFLLPRAGRAPVVLVAAGIGITPFLGLLETLAAEAPPEVPPITLYHCNRDAASRAFAPRIAELAPRIPGMQVIDVYSRTAGRLTAAAMAQHLIDAHARFYLCGPDAMLRSLTEGLVARGVHRFAIFRESFQGVAYVGPADEGTFRVRFERSGRELTWTGASGTLLQLGLDQGLELPSGCRVGQCESCLLRVRSGRVRHLAEVDLAEEGTCLGCLAIPCSDVVLDA
ncbi:molybdopterin dinucleotide binding domain-containing protein [Caenimonas sedimenti]|uniref:molybdopterin dinucleotide binding domain-containing protein n=1 Tax=Caenimonas sedimenti TaxID=2596921 RepID=UPI0021054EE2|nr:molybdopterin dinucleotide binding domain-containing protein [Caenimonas sedimenti]